MTIIYIPINPENINSKKQQNLYVDKLAKDGWKIQGYVELKDILETRIKVAVMKNDNIILKE